MEFCPKLPQDDLLALARKAELLISRQEYQYNYTYIPTVPMSQRVPLSQYPHLAWWKGVLEELVTVLSNLVVLSLEKDHKAWCESMLKTLKGEGGLHRLLNIPELLKQCLAGLLESTDPARALRLQDINDQFTCIKIPDVSRDFQQDDVFARMQVTGPNPMVIEGIFELPSNFPMTQELFVRAPGFENDRLDKALKEGRLFLTNYKKLAAMESGSFPLGPKYANAPIALFGIPAGQGARSLLPVSIQCTQESAPDAPIFTPDDGFGWEMAKTVVLMANGNYHELISHLSQTHLVVERFVLATHRNLAECHPLSILLRPHFQGTIYINELAHTELIAPKRGVDRLLMGTIESDHQVVVEAIHDWHFDANCPPQELANRKVLSAQLDYPYRDDALLIWDAILQWTTAYVALYYRNDRAVLEDYELQNWAKELIAEDGGRLKGFGEGGGIKTRAYLAKALAQVIFTGSVQHACVNFPQYLTMSYTPAMPLATYRPAPTRKTGMTRQDWLDMFPPLSLTALQMNLGFFLGSLYCTRLGDYGSDHFKDQAVSPLLDQFVTNLAHISSTIAERNKLRVPYTILCPSKIPQSINI